MNKLEDKADDLSRKILDMVSYGGNYEAVKKGLLEFANEILKSAGVVFVE